MKNTAKKSLAVLLTACMLLAVVCSLGSVSIIASAAHPDYYEFVEMPGFGVWTDEELATLYEEYTAAPVHSTENLPEGVDDAVKFTITSVDKTWGSATINSGNLRNKNTATQEPGFSWGAMSLPGGKSIVGDKTFADSDGICFWVGGAGGRYEGKMKMQMFLAECRGPFYDYNKGLDDGTNELGDAPIGYRYESTSKGTDADGYIFFDFDEDFRQVDWWATDDDGINQSVSIFGETNLKPIPEKVRETMNGITVCFLNVSVGTEIYIADIKGYKDTRVFVDSLDDAISRFDSLNPDAYTEASYMAATEVYLEAVEMFTSGDEFTQTEIDFAARRLNCAIDGLDPMFPAKSSTEIAGFEVWDDDDLLEMADGGVCTDVAYFEEAEDGTDIVIISTASTGAPDYGWSRFISAIDGGGSYEAVKNPFGADLSNTAGFCFTLKYEGTYQPTDIQLGVGVTDGPYFIAANPDVKFPEAPEREGLVSVAWSAFYDEEDDEDIYDWLDQLDYFELRLADSTQEQFRIRDLYAFEWAINDADFAPAAEAAEAARAELEELGETNFYPAGWEEYVAAIDKAAMLPDVYGATDEDVVDAVSAIETARNALVPIGSADYGKMKDLHETYKAAGAFWYGNYTLSAGTKLNRAIDAYARVMDTAISNEDADELLADFQSAVTGLKAISPKTINDTAIYSFEDYTPFDLDYCMAYRSSGVAYSLAENSDGVQALSMKVLRYIAAGDDAAMRFYPFFNDYLTRPLKKSALVGDLSKITGFFFDVEVNDLSLTKDALLTFGVLNRTADKHFNKCADTVRIPASGKGRVYVPINSLLVTPDDSTGSIALNNIDGYYFEVTGEVCEGFEIKITNICAYTGTTNAVPEAPEILNVTEGEDYEAGFIPQWSDGVALLDGEYYVFGTPIVYNGGHKLTVGTGANSTEVNFTISGGVEPPAPANKKGDPTGNGKIEVDDALAALRVAAKLAEPTPELLATCDIDGNGKIEVDDALAILRVAAKLADETSLG
ncbi:MAG: dockerin type I repeat-containing protein [Clostridia bacterium]|nr:dockerin type I repeat-containing protein [Clostridia bacterium]